MQETKFNLYGEFIRPNGFQKYDILSYIAETREEAIATCKRNNPHFNIITIQVDDTAPEVVKLQSLIWWEFFSLPCLLSSVLILGSSC